MIAALILIVLSGAPPDFDLNTVCKSARSSATNGEEKAVFDSCVRDEQAAHDKLKVRWVHYSAPAQAACGGVESLAPSYVELWTCLEMQPGGSLSLTAANPASPDAKLLPGAPPPPGTPGGPNAAVGSGAPPSSSTPSAAPSVVAPPPGSAPSAPAAAASAPAPGASAAGVALPPTAATGASPSAPAPGVK